MELAFSLLIILAGVIAFLVRKHQETPGAITFVVIVCAIYLAPIALAKFICEVASPQVAFVFCMIIIAIIAILTIYYIFNHDKVDGKLMSKQFERAHEATKRVSELPPPSDEELQKYMVFRINLADEEENIRIYGKKFVDSARLGAMNRWRQEKYNEIFKELNHGMVVEFKNQRYY